MVVERLCPVCGYEMDDSPRDFNICPSCGTEFGLHDVNSSIENLREAWLEGGARWHSCVIAAPDDWNPYVQLGQILLNVPTRVEYSAARSIMWSFANASAPRSVTTARRRSRRRIAHYALNSYGLVDLMQGVRKVA